MQRDLFTACYIHEVLQQLFAPHKTGRLRLVNNWLTIVVSLLAAYIILAPFLPQASWVINEYTPAGNITDTTELVAAAASKPPTDMGGNRLFVPRLSLNERIYEGGVEQLNKGVLRRDFTSTPAAGSNTVLVGHRFGYDGTGVFYHLDKLKAGDEITLHWQGKTYAYRVQDKKVVNADDGYIEEPTDSSVLTLYTCTPLWNPVQRLVITAELTAGGTL